MQRKGAVTHVDRPTFRQSEEPREGVLALEVRIPRPDLERERRPEMGPLRNGIMVHTPHVRAQMLSIDAAAVARRVLLALPPLAPGAVTAGKRTDPEQVACRAGYRGGSIAGAC